MSESTIRPHVIGVAGGSGSGKSSLARRLVESRPEGSARLVALDWYYRDLSQLDEAERARVNFDEPSALELDLLVEHLGELVAGRTVAAPRYDFATHCRLEGSTPVAPAELIVVEGLHVLAWPPLRERLDLAVYLDADRELCLSRRAARDGVERGRDPESIRRQFLDTVWPMHQRHVEPSRANADLVLDARESLESSLAAVTAALEVRS
ncbi:MAG: uridine kinase [Acidobacteriota bacterium]